MPLVKAVVVKLSATGVEDAKLQIDRVRVAADELAKTNPKITPQIESAKALIEARLLRDGIKKELSGAASGSSGPGLIEKLLFGGGGAAGLTAGFKTAGAGGGGIISTILGGAGSLASSGPVGIGILVGLAAAAAELAAALASIVAPLVAATFGIAAFGAVAFPVVSEILAGVTAVDAATTKVAQNKAWAAIPASLRPAVQGVLGLKSAFDQISKTLQPDILKVFNQGLKIANSLLPFVGQFAKAAAPAILGLLKGFDQFTHSTGFKQFMTQMQALAGPAITVIGNGIGKIIIAVGNLIKDLASPEGLVVLGGVFKGIELGIRFIGDAFLALTKAIFADGPPILRGVAIITAGIGAFVDGILGLFQSVIDGAARLANIFLPGSGIAKGLSAQAKSFDAWRAGIAANFAKVHDAFNRYAQDLQRAPKIFTLQANITDLTNKLATARKKLSDPHLTETKRVRVEANISDLLSKIRAAQIDLASLQNKTITIGVQEFFPSGNIGGGGGHTNPGMATGGIVQSGWTRVGEQGPELVHLPGGSMVYPANTSRSMGTRGDVHIHFHSLVTDRNAGRLAVEAIKKYEEGSGASWRR